METEFWDWLPWVSNITCNIQCHLLGKQLLLFYGWGNLDSVGHCESIYLLFYSLIQSDQHLLITCQLPWEEAGDT